MTLNSAAEARLSRGSAGVAATDISTFIFTMNGFFRCTICDTKAGCSPAAPRLISYVSGTNANIKPRRSLSMLSQRRIRASFGPARTPATLSASSDGSMRTTSCGSIALPRLTGGSRCAQRLSRNASSLSDGL